MREIVGSIDTAGLRRVTTEVVKPSSASSKKGTLAIRSPHVYKHTCAPGL